MSLALVALTQSVMGTCPKVDTISSINTEMYAGHWYQAIINPARQQYQDKPCAIATYTANKDGSVGVVNRARDGNTDKYISVTGKAVCPAKNGSCEVQFFGAPFTGKPNYNVIYTDYTGFSIVYSCDESLGPDYVGVLSRTPELTPTQYAKVISIIHQKLPFFDTNRLLKTP